MAGTPTPAHSLPTYLSRFIGREPQLDELTTLLGDGRRRAEQPSGTMPVRVVTLTGVGGAGKTRLAHAFARRLATSAADPTSQRPADVYWVSLESVSDPSRVAQQVAAALGLHEAVSEHPVHALVNVLRDRRSLLVLDNCEQVAAACRQLVTTVLPSCPEVRFLATSRKPLELDEEQVYPVPAMPAAADSTPDPGRAGDAVRLFLDRAASATAVDIVAADELETIQAICQRLVGLPLAIELAASWYRVLSPADLLKEIDQSPAVLSAADGRVAGRHRSLDAVLASSWSWLDPDAQHVLKRLTVLQGEFSRDAAVAVGGANLTSLAALVERSLIQRSPGPGGSTRYRMHGLVRQFAARQLGPADMVGARQAHLEFFLALLDQGAEVWETVHEPAFLDRLKPDQTNLEAALDWAVSRGQAEAAVRLCAGLFTFWMYSAPVSDYASSLEQALALPWPRGAASEPRVKALMLAGYAAVSVDDFDRARSRFDEAHARCVDGRDPRALAWALRGRGFHARLTGDAAGARRDAGASLTLCRAEGDPAGEAWSLHALGETQFLVGRLEEAGELFEEALALFDLAGVPFGAYRALTLLGAVARRQFLWSAAADRYRKALDRQQHRHFTSRGADLLEGIAEMAATLHHPVDAARLFGAAETWRRSFGYSRYLFDAADWEQGVQEAQGQVSRSTWSSNFAEGARLTSAQAVDAARQCALQIASTTASHRPAPGLTEREIQVLHLVVLGLHNSAIATRLTISPRTVHAHLRSIFEKLHVDSRTAAAHEAVKLNLG
jgi:predicted ATPase/DNA-binding CsgD family transcriptional regulator